MYLFQFASYAYRKSLSAGFCSLALLSANSFQMKLLFNITELTPQGKAVLVLIGLSICLQLIFGSILAFVATREQDDNIKSRKNSTERGQSSTETQSSTEDDSSDVAANDNYEKLKKSRKNP